MKKIAVILIFAILLVKAGGYNMIISWSQQDAYNQMVERLDRADYNEKDLIEISAPLELPYYTDWDAFERRDGQITINGTVYNYVARKYTNNVMVYKCIPNTRHQRISNLKKDIDQIAFNDFDQTKNKKQAAPQLSSLSEYDDVLPVYHCASAYSLRSRKYAVHQPALRSMYYDQPTPPPDAA